MLYTHRAAGRTRHHSQAGVTNDATTGKAQALINQTKSQQIVGQERPVDCIVLAQLEATGNISEHKHPRPAASEQRPCLRSSG